ncbi:MAG: hypothetical protein K2L17_07290 [Muribaculaceae bacterium]|nr:hypothetical protein [Muribaculaceae bacterium]
MRLSIDSNATEINFIIAIIILYQKQKPKQAIAPERASDLFLVLTAFAPPSPSFVKSILKLADRMQMPKSAMVVRTQ